MDTTTSPASWRACLAANLAEGAGAGLPGLLALHDALAGKTVAVIPSGSNVEVAPPGATRD